MDFVATRATVLRIWFAVVLLVAACGSGDGDDVAADQPTELQLTFTGDSCSYVGPNETAAGPATLTFVNTSDEFAFVEFLWHTGDETAQDMIDHIGEEPSSNAAPPWTREVRGSYHVSEPGETFMWEGELEPATHALLCGMAAPTRIRIGGVFTITG